MAAVVLRHELEILRLIAVGEKEIEAGVGYDMDSVFAEVDKLLNERKFIQGSR